MYEDIFNLFTKHSQYKDEMKVTNFIGSGILVLVKN